LASLHSMSLRGALPISLLVFICRRVALCASAARTPPKGSPAVPGEPAALAALAEGGHGDSRGCCRAVRGGTVSGSTDSRAPSGRSEEHTSELQSRENLV